MLAPFENINNTELTLAVRQLPQPQGVVLNTVLPDTYEAQVEYRIREIEKVGRVAVYRPYDAPGQKLERDAFTDRRGLIPPITMWREVGELERIRLEALRSGGDADAVAADAIWADAPDLRDSIIRKAELSRARVLLDHVLDLSVDGQPGVTIDMQVPASRRKTAATAWSDSTNANPVGDLRAWVDEVEDAGGSVGRIIMRRSTYNLIANADAVRAGVAQFPGGPTPANVAAFLAANGVPPIQILNSVVVDEAGSETAIIPHGRLVFAPEEGARLGRTLWGIPAVALDAIGGDFTIEDAPGIFVSAWKQTHPVYVAGTQADAIVVPVIEDRRSALSATVDS